MKHGLLIAIVTLVATLPLHAADATAPDKVKDKPATAAAGAAKAAPADAAHAKAAAPAKDPAADAGDHKPRTHAETMAAAAGREAAKAEMKNAKMAGGKTTKEVLEGAGKGKEKGKGKGKAAKGGEEDGEAKSRDGGSSLTKEEDFIETVLGDLIHGKIHKEQDDFVIMLVNEEKGRIRVPREKIKNINFSIGSRLGALEKDDFLGQYKVGMWAMEKNMYPEAVEIFEKLKVIRSGPDEKAKKNEDDPDAPIDEEKEKHQLAAREGAEKIPDDLLKQLGRAYEERGQLDKALATYKEYAQGHINDLDAAAAVVRLDEKVNPKSAAGDPAKKAIVNGLEGDGNWQGEKWDNANPCIIQFTSDKDGNKMIVVQSEGGAKDKMAFTRNGPPALNLSESTEMHFRAFNDGDKPINLACAFINADSDFDESRQSRIMPKQWIKLSFKIDGKLFKSNRNDFKAYDQGLKGREHIARITFMIYDQRPAKLFIDDLFFK